MLSCPFNLWQSLVKIHCSAQVGVESRTEWRKWVEKIWMLQVCVWSCIFKAFVSTVELFCSFHLSETHTEVELYPHAWCSASCALLEVTRKWQLVWSAAMFLKVIALALWDCCSLAVWVGPALTGTFLSNMRLFMNTWDLFTLVSSDQKLALLCKAINVGQEIAL